MNMCETKINEKLGEMLNEFEQTPLYNLDSECIRELIQEAYNFGYEVGSSEASNEND